MIHDLDATLKELLVQKVPIDLASVDIKFEMPSAEWGGSVTRPTIDLFLYDIRENHELRSNARQLARQGSVATETRSPPRVDLTYAISVWTSDIADEHRLLGGLLKTLLSYPVLPEEVLKGGIASQPFPVRGWIAQPDRTPNAWDFWGALDGRLKADLSYVVTLAVEAVKPVEVGLVTEKVLKLGPRL
jgi:uncharacterized protein DUF4255